MESNKETKGEEREKENEVGKIIPSLHALFLPLQYLSSIVVEICVSARIPPSGTIRSSLELFPKRRLVCMLATESSLSLGNGAEVMFDVYGLSWSTSSRPELLWPGNVLSSDSFLLDWKREKPDLVLRYCRR